MERLDIDWIAGGLILVGAFYVFAGLVATRAALISFMLDRALMAISGKRPATRETALSAWLLLSANLVLAGGAALMLRLELALWLFGISLVGQLVYLLVLAPRYFDLDDPPDPVGRRRTVNAAAIYAIATGVVVWAATKERLSGLSEVPGYLSVAAAALVGGHTVYTIWQANLRAAAPSSTIADQLEARSPASQAKSIAVMAAQYRFPLWSMETGGDDDFPPEELGLSAALCGDLLDWGEAYMASFAEDDPDKCIWNREQLQAHEAAGRGLALRIASERPDIAVHVFSPERGFEPVTAPAPFESDKLL